VQKVLSQLPEVNKMYRVLIPTLGFKSVSIQYYRNLRFAGESKYGVKPLINLGVKSLLATSGAPLRWISIFAATLSIILLLLSVLFLLAGIENNEVPGWASLALLISLMFFFQALTTMVICEFLLIMMADIRQRPTYQIGLEDEKISS
jgi:dolichol-phosphate mannosyltransferase